MRSMCQQRRTNGDQNHQKERRQETETSPCAAETYTAGTEAGAGASHQVLSLARRHTETIKFPKSYRGRRRGREALSDERGFAPIYAADKYVQQEAGEPQSIGRVALRPFQFCGIHRTLRMTPLMAAGVTDRLWSVEELIELAGGKCAADF